MKKSDIVALLSICRTVGLRGTWGLVGLFWHSRKPRLKRKALVADLRGFGEVLVPMDHNDFFPSREERRLSRWIQLNWEVLWPEVVAGMNATLAEYNYGKNVAEILADARNELSIDLSESRTTKGAAWSASLNIELEHGGGHLVYLIFTQEGECNGGMCF